MASSPPPLKRQRHDRHSPLEDTNYDSDDCEPEAPSPANSSVRDSAYRAAAQALTSGSWVPGDAAVPLIGGSESIPKFSALESALAAGTDMLDKAQPSKTLSSRSALRVYRPSTASNAPPVTIASDEVRVLVFWGRARAARPGPQFRALSSAAVASATSLCRVATSNCEQL